MNIEHLLFSDRLSGIDRAIAFSFNGQLISFIPTIIFLVQDKKQEGGLQSHTEKGFHEK